MSAKVLCKTSCYHPSTDQSVDSALLDLLTGPAKPSPKSFARRDAPLDPLLLAAAAASGPHVTRNHYHHDFFPGVSLPKAEGAWDWTKFTGEQYVDQQEPKRYVYASRQAPRRQRLLDSGDKKGNVPLEIDTPDHANTIVPPPSKKRRPSIVSPAIAADSEQKSRPKSISVAEPTPPQPVPQVEVKCMARTRIPTPHGPAFLHIYHNNRDNKEHLAIVIDPAQLSDNPSASLGPPIRSQSLDAVWNADETEMDRIIRGAYVGRLSATSQKASSPPSSSTGLLPKHIPTSLSNTLPPPLIRIHSECFTGETVGSMRCDCGEQLDEAIRQISIPVTLPSITSPVTIPGRGAVVYLRQEGRGIGLLSKIRAYNLQDMGHDTVTANLMLGHKADERGYEIAVAILQDLGLGRGDGTPQGGVRVLTNNPDKVAALENEGLEVAERVPMIPRSWQQRSQQAQQRGPHDALATANAVPLSTTVMGKHTLDEERKAGATLIGGGAVYGEDLDKYLRTKVLRMGHMLPLWLEDAKVGY